MNKLAEIHSEEKIKKTEVMHYLSTSKEIYSLDWKRYVKKSQLKIDESMKVKVRNECFKIMKKKKDIYSLYTLKEKLEHLGIRHEHLSPFAIGWILLSENRFTKVGKTWIAIRDDLTNSLLKKETHIINEAIESAYTDNLDFEIPSTRLFLNNEDKATLKSIGQKHGVTSPGVLNREKMLIEKIKNKLSQKFKKQEQLIYAFLKKDLSGFT